jgi:hypothetical protein
MKLIRLLAAVLAGAGTAGGRLGPGVTHVAPAGSVWLNRARLLCVLVDES